MGVVIFKLINRLTCRSNGESYTHEIYFGTEIENLILNLALTYCGYHWMLLLFWYINDYHVYNKIVFWN